MLISFSALDKDILPFMHKRVPVLNSNKSIIVGVDCGVVATDTSVVIVEVVVVAVVIAVAVVVVDVIGAFL